MCWNKIIDKKLNCLFIIWLLLHIVAIMDKKLNAIKQHFNGKTTIYIPIDINTSITKIHDLLFNNILFDPTCTVEYLYLGYYHYNITQKYDLAKEYYSIAIDNGSTIGMINMANYYSHIEIDYNLMKKYYLMAVDHGDMRAMNNLGYYYQFTEKNYDLMKKCYLVAIENNVCQSMNNLKIYYHSITNYKGMIMCNLMKTQIDKDPNNITMLGLGKYYCNFDITMKRLELYLNYSIIISRYNIIGRFNELVIQELTPKQKINFKQLVDSYEFNYEDELCEELQLFIKN